MTTFHRKNITLHQLAYIRNPYVAQFRVQFRHIRKALNLKNNTLQHGTK